MHDRSILIFFIKKKVLIIYVEKRENNYDIDYSNYSIIGYLMIY